MAPPSLSRILNTGDSDVISISSGDRSDAISITDTDVDFMDEEEPYQWQIEIEEIMTQTGCEFEMAHDVYDQLYSDNCARKSIVADAIQTIMDLQEIMIAAECDYDQALEAYVESCGNMRVSKRYAGAPEDEEGDQQVYEDQIEEIAMKAAGYEVTKQEGMVMFYLPLKIRQKNARLAEEERIRLLQQTQ